MDINANVYFILSDQYCCNKLNSYIAIDHRKEAVISLLSESNRTIDETTMPTIISERVFVIKVYLERKKKYSLHGQKYNPQPESGINSESSLRSWRGRNCREM